MAARDRVGDPGPRRVEQRDEPQENTHLGLLAIAGDRRHRSARRRDPQHAQPAGERSTPAGSRRGAVSRAPAPRPSRDRAARRAAVRRALDVHPAAVALGRRCSSACAPHRIEQAPAPCARARAHVRAERARLQQRDLGRIAAPPPPSPSSALLHVATGREPPRASAGSRADSPRRRSPRRPASRPAVTRMRFSVSVPVLSVQITVVEPSVSTADRRLTSARRRASLAHADRERERDRRQQPLRHVRDEQTDREDHARRDRQARDEPSRSARTHPDRDRHDRDQAATRAPAPATGSPRCRRAGTAPRSGPSSVCIPVRRRPPGPPRRAGRPAEDEVARSRAAARRGSSRSADAPTGPIRRSTPRCRSGRALDQLGVGRDPVALGDQQQITRHELGGASISLRPSRTTGVRRQVPREASTARSACRSCKKANMALSTMTTTIATANAAMPRHRQQLPPPTAAGRAGV